jgi:hypothetical protein
MCLTLAFAAAMFLLHWCGADERHAVPPPWRPWWWL